MGTHKGRMSDPLIASGFASDLFSTGPQQCSEAVCRQLPWLPCHGRSGELVHISCSSHFWQRRGHCIEGISSLQGADLHRAPVQHRVQQAPSPRPAIGLHLQALLHRIACM